MRVVLRHLWCEIGKFSVIYFSYVMFSVFLSGLSGKASLLQIRAGSYHHYGVLVCFGFSVILVMRALQNTCLGFGLILQMLDKNEQTTGEQLLLMPSFKAWPECFGKCLFKRCRAKSRELALGVKTGKFRWVLSNAPISWPCTGTGPKIFRRNLTLHNLSIIQRTGLTE